MFGFDFSFLSSNKPLSFSLGEIKRYKIENEKQAQNPLCYVCGMKSTLLASDSESQQSQEKGKCILRLFLAAETDERQDKGLEVILIAN